MVTLVHQKKMSLIFSPKKIPPDILSYVTISKHMNNILHLITTSITVQWCSEDFIPALCRH